MILEIPKSNFLTNLLQAKGFEKIRGYDNFGFIGLSGLIEPDEKQWIEIGSEKPELSQPLIDMLFNVKKSSGKLRLTPKVAIYKFVVKEAIDPLSVFKSGNFAGKVSFQVVSPKWSS